MANDDAYMKAVGEDYSKLCDDHINCDRYRKALERISDEINKGHPMTALMIANEALNGQ